MEIQILASIVTEDPQKQLLEESMFSNVSRLEEDLWMAT